MGTIIKMAWRNLWCNRRRTLITVASVFFGVLLSAYMTSMQEGSYDMMVNIVVKYYSGYIQIHHTDYWENKSINNTLDYSDSLVTLLESYPQTAVVFPRLESFALASTENHSKGVVLFGIEPGKEDQWTGLSQKITRGHYLQQRAAVARALASRPEFVLADEPTANLDSKSAENLLEIMEELNKEEKITFIFSTHDQRVVNKARRIITLEDGKVVNDIRQS